MNITDLTGRLAVVTGAGSGIGRATALVLAQHGATVMCVDRDSGKLAATIRLLSEAGLHGDRYICDVGNPEDVKRVIGHITEAYGAPSYLVNSAGIMPRADILSITPDKMDEVTRVNQYGPLFMAQAVWPHMAAIGGGAIINLGSIQANTVRVRPTYYGPTKAALVSMTVHLANAGREANIRAVCVSPGAIKTEGMGSWDGLPEAFVKDWRTHTPAGRRGTAFEVAHAIAFLCSDAASYVTGCVLDVDGGMATEGRPTALIPEGHGFAADKDPDATPAA